MSSRSDTDQEEWKGSRVGLYDSSILGDGKLGSRYYTIWLRFTGAHSDHKDFNKSPVANPNGPPPGHSLFPKEMEGLRLNEVSIQIHSDAESTTIGGFSVFVVASLPYPLEVSCNRDAILS